MDISQEVDGSGPPPCVLGTDQPLRGEERHLGVVGERAEATVGRDEVAAALGAEPTPDLRERQKLDRRPQGIADRPTKKAAAKGRDHPLR